MTREKLFSLNNTELKNLAYKHGFSINNAEFDRETLLEELFEDLQSLDIEKYSSHSSIRRYESTEETSYIYRYSNDPEIYNFVLPNCYNQTSLIFIQRDPFWAFVDWEVAPTQMAEFQQMPSYKGIVLTLSCFTYDKDNFQFKDAREQTLTGNCGTQYVQLLHTDGAYWHQVGLKILANSKEYPMACSEKLLTSV